MFNCPRCKAELPGDPRVCPHCGADQGGGVQPSAYQPTSAAYEANWSAAYPCVAIDSAAAFMVARGFVLEPRTESSANFGNREEPNVALGCFLMLFLIIPGVIYLLVGGTDQHTTLLLVLEEEGSRVVIGGDSAGGRQALRWWVNSIVTSS